ncbi:2-hydroxychromene-2-carboxylate isomerase [Neptunicoccus cionae]|uniref:2-hydroxychromene-2-carboxylate isomerase n=1 Tax=Neptunicoccus cionae TaxID=2035344 RepID=UPI000C78D4C1|nr:2-hydroxychromene-2-carboxylate isomerase [Amylibacter cionae]PLS21875.1 2-hydroxychromene-2-carboxylate isomerase [Amylibacter cionae]
MAHIDYFTITLSPFAYLAGTGLEEVARKHGATITYKPFNLMQVFEQTGGTPPAQRHPARQAYRLQELARIAKRNDMPINLKPAHFPTNPAPSCYALIAAQDAGGGDLGGLCHSFLRACWAEEKDVAEDSVIRACLEKAGFDPKLADSGLLSGAQTFEKNTEEALQRNVFGAPSYVVGDQVFWGQDRLSYLDDYLSELGK